MTITDQLNRNISLHGPARRIVSLVPSQTELLADLGLSEEVIGITKFCVHPEEWFRTKTRIGGTKRADVSKIRSLRPDLIIANKEENDSGTIEDLSADVPVWVSDISTLDDALSMISSVGILTGREQKAGEIIGKIRTSFEGFKPDLNGHPDVLYLIWNDPPMAAGKDTFISEMLSRCGFRNYIQSDRYPEVDMTTVRSGPPQLVFLSSEPFPFKEKHAETYRKLLPESRVFCVDGEAFSWYGSRLLHSVSYFRKLLDEVRTAG